MVEILTEEEYRQGQISLIRESIEEGKFQRLSSRAQQILTERYLGEKVPSRKMIGNMLELPVGGERVRQIEAKALRILRAPKLPIDVLNYRREEEMHLREQDSAHIP